MSLEDIEELAETSRSIKVREILTFLINKNHLRKTYTARQISIAFKDRDNETTYKRILNKFVKLGFCEVVKTKRKYSDNSKINYRLKY